MTTDTDRTIVRLDGYTRACLTAITALLALLVFGLWAGPMPTVDTAHAADPPSGIYGPTVQRTQQIEATKATNQKLDQLISLLKSGQVKVQVVEKATSEGGSNHVPGLRKK